MAGLLAYSIFAAFPSLPINIGIGTVASSTKINQSLQLRVQLRPLTGFPLDTYKSITISAAKIRQKPIQESIFMLNFPDYNG
jgi:hypothetical protein